MTYFLTTGNPSAIVKSYNAFRELAQYGFTVTRQVGYLLHVQARSRVERSYCVTVTVWPRDVVINVGGLDMRDDDPVRFMRWLDDECPLCVRSPLASSVITLVKQSIKN